MGSKIFPKSFFANVPSKSTSLYEINPPKVTILVGLKMLQYRKRFYIVTLYKFAL